MNAILETGISLVLIFFIFSTITYVIQELIAVNLKYRSKMLWKSMAQLFDGEGLPGRMQLMKALPTNMSFTNIFYDHPQIRILQQNLKKKPSYIPAANFALAVMDMIAAKAPDNVKQNRMFEDFKSGLEKFVESKGSIYEVLKNLAATSNSLHDLQLKIEDWFNSYMQRVSTWYQSHTIVTVRIISVAVTLFFNVNVINLTKTIYSNGQLRSNLVALADNVVDHPETVTQYYSKSFEEQNSDLISSYDARIAAADSTVRDSLQREKADTLSRLAGRYTKLQLGAIDSLTGKLKSADLPLGWKQSPLCSASWEGNIWLILLGWLIAAGCISMGAPFWFNMLNKLVNVRRSGKPSTNKD